MALLDAYPAAAARKGFRGFLPLQLAAAAKAPVQVVAALLAVHPAALCILSPADRRLLPSAASLVSILRMCAAVRRLPAVLAWAAARRRRPDPVALAPRNPFATKPATLASSTSFAAVPAALAAIESGSHTDKQVVAVAAEATAATAPSMMVGTAASTAPAGGSGVTAIASAAQSTVA